MLFRSSGLSYMYSSEDFRLYVSDTGLLVTLMFMDKEFTDNIIYSKLLSDKLPVNLGIVYENVVAQILASKSNRVFYHTFADKKQKRNYEVDFILPDADNGLIPITVRASGYKTHKAMDVFTDKYADRISNKLLVYTKDFVCDNDVLCIPFYMLSWVEYIR